jgi:hypothetical protein
MKSKRIYSAQTIAALFIVLSVFISSCITDPGVNKKRSSVKDFSVTTPVEGCGEGLLVIAFKNVTDNGLCVTDCGKDTGYHKATNSELIDYLKNNSKDPETYMKDKIASSSGACIEDKSTGERPTLAIDIKSDFCSCLNGKSDLISDCSTFCASTTSTTSPTLFLNTIPGPDVALNTNFGNLYNWCNTQLPTDTAQPQCFLSANDGANEINSIPVTINPNSNSLTANIQQLAVDKTYIVKIYEGKTGTYAQTKEFQLRRKAPTADDQPVVGALKISPISQYTCLSFSIPKDGSVTSYSRFYYYFAGNETPPPIPPTTTPGSTITTSSVICHDTQLHPGNDSVEYPRLELIPQHFSMWEKTDPRFVLGADGKTPTINNILTTRLFNEYGITATLDLFQLIKYFNRPQVAGSSASNVVPLGYIMIPFSDKSGNTFCPTQKDFNSNDPLFSLLKDYMDDTEGVYTAEKEAEILLDGNGSYTVRYGTIFITESVLKQYGFYIENGLKIRATQASMNTKTIYFYWPISATDDPLTQGNRKLFTVRTPDTLQGNAPTGQSTTQRSTDKRIGCVPKSR